MPRRTYEESMKYWGEVVGEQQASGLSIRQFCEERKVVQTLFYKWRKRLNEAAQSENPHDNNLVPVTVIDRPTNADDSQVEIRVDGSLSIFVRAGFDVDTLRDVVGALRLSTNGEATTC